MPCVVPLVDLEFLRSVHKAQTVDVHVRTAMYGSHAPFTFNSQTILLTMVCMGAKIMHIILKPSSKAPI